MPIARVSTVTPSPTGPRGLPGAGPRVDFIAFVAAKLNATPAEIAAARGASRNTVRNQLASVMAKTDTNRQAEVVALFATLI